MTLEVLLGDSHSRASIWSGVVGRDLETRVFEPDWHELDWSEAAKLSFELEEEMVVQPGSKFGAERGGYGKGVEDGELEGPAGKEKTMTFLEHDWD